MLSTQSSSTDLAAQFLLHSEALHIVENAYSNEENEGKIYKKKRERI
jgi:hypothetical protein